ncbi:MAG: hypothetical protein IT382_01000 [Deltaproteobacteria bacterium]|nr:hypothetical protein [Deltaproteobacteria bacterium]
MPIVPCPQCAKPMEQDDGFCGSCGAITDPDLTLDESAGGPFGTAPDTAPLPSQAGLEPAAPTATGRHQALTGLDMGGDFDERTDVSPSPLHDPPPPPPVATGEKPADNFQAFLEENTGAMERSLFEEETGTHRADRQNMVQPQVVLRCKAGVDRAALSPFEQHVLSFLDGRRPLARLRKKAGLSFGDLKVAIGMLADRGVLEVVGNFVPDLKGLLEEDELVDSGPHGILPKTAPEPVAGVPPQAVATPRRAPPAPAPPPAPKAPRPAVAPLPGQGAALPRTGTPSGVRAVAAPPPPVVLSNPGIDPKRLQANQLLERALTELRAGKRPAAIALVRMAAELVPGDPRIEATLKSLLV